MSTATTEPLKYVEHRTLRCRDSCNIAPDEELETPILVGTIAALLYTEGESSYGRDHCALYPAWADGKRAWLKRASWSPSYGYSAEGTQDTILPFEDGCRILIERGCFAFPTMNRSE